MRDPKRILDTIDLFQSLWNLYPDLRFGQLCAIIQSKAAGQNKDLFQMEENEVNELLYDLILKGV